MSNMKEKLKSKIKEHPAHTQLIHPVEEDTNVNVNENVYVDVNVNIDKPKRKRFEETHSRQTYYIENDLIEKLNQQAGSEKGEKTRIVNEAIRWYLENSKH